MAPAGNRRRGRYLDRVVLPLAVLAGVLGMHGLGAVDMPGMTAAHSSTMRPVAAEQALTALPVVTAHEALMCAQHPCVAVLRSSSTVPEPGALTTAGAQAEGVMPLAGQAVSVTPRAPPEDVSLTRLCVCRT
jgi:hypothetical protein